MSNFNCALVTGRFQTFHNGHYNNIRRAMSIAYKVIVVIGSAQEYGTERNPFSIELRKLIMEDVFASELSGRGDKLSIITLEDMTNENDHCHAWGDYLIKGVQKATAALNKQGYASTPDLIIYGNDGEASSPTQWFSEEWMARLSFLMVNRPEGAISATELRNFMLLDKQAEWEKKVPYQIKRYYSFMRQQLLSVPYYKKLALELMREDEK